MVITKEQSKPNISYVGFKHTFDVWITNMKKAFKKQPNMKYLIDAINSNIISITLFWCLYC